MKLRTIIGFGLGYVLGARSQSEDTNDPQDLVQSVTQSEAFKTVLQQAQQLAASGVQAVTGQEPSWAPQQGVESGSSGESGSEEQSSGSGQGGSSGGGSGQSGQSGQSS